MISFEEVKRLIRFKEKDNNEIKFSDYEVRMAVNECIRYLNNNLALLNSDFLEKTQDFTDIDTSVGIDLPEDYVALISVMRMCDGYVMTPVQAIQKPNDNEYKVVGSKLYSGTPAFTMLYKAAIAEIKSDSDGIELPFVFKDVLVKLSCMILNNAETDIMMKAVDEAVRALIPRRRYSNARIKMPFKI